jgi:carboxyltransferase family protein
LANWILTAGTDVFRALTGEKVTTGVVGRAHTHAWTSCVTAFAEDDKENRIRDVRYLLSSCRRNNREQRPALPADDPEERRDEALLDLASAEPYRSYDTCTVLGEFSDGGTCFEMHPIREPDAVSAFIRLAKYVVGVVSDQSTAPAGVLDVDDGETTTRLIGSCDGFADPSRDDGDYVRPSAGGGTACGHRRHGTAWHGEAWHGVVLHDRASCGMVSGCGGCGSQGSSAYRAQPRLRRLSTVLYRTASPELVGCGHA